MKLFQSECSCSLIFAGWLFTSHFILEIRFPMILFCKKASSKACKLNITYTRFTSFPQFSLRIVDNYNGEKKVLLLFITFSDIKTWYGDPHEKYNASCNILGNAPQRNKGIFFLCRHPRKPLQHKGLFLSHNSFYHTTYPYKFVHYLSSIVIVMYES